jgi:hypothetical protein
VTTQCASCHPNYATKEDVAAMTLRLKKFQVTSFRDDMYGGILKESEYRTTLYVTDEPAVAKHGAKSENKEQGEHGKKDEATKATKPAKYFAVSSLPPDFTRTPLRSGDDLEDLYRTIAAGVGGTAMPSWILTAAYTDPNTGEHWDAEKDIWALAHYVKSLVKLRDTKEADAFHDKLAHQAAFTPPPPEPAADATAASSAAPATSAPPAKSVAPARH